MLLIRVLLSISLLLIFECYATLIELSNTCNKELQYNSARPIHIENDPNTWSVSSPALTSCQLIINTTQTDYNHFMIRVNVNDNESANRISIIDHDHVTNKNVTLLNETGITNQFKTINFIQIESSCFEINLLPGPSNELFFRNVRSITITRVTQTNKNKCKENEFKCKPSNVCIDQSLLCDNIASCSDSSDEANCTHSTTTTTVTNNNNLPATVIINTNSSIDANVTLITINDDSKTSRNKVKYLIGFVVIVALLAGTIFGAWTYGKRKQKWREFLAQLDNNTDWEYEQLDDNHHPMSSRASLPTMAPMFDIKITEESRDRAERVPIN